MEPILIEKHREGCWGHKDYPWAFLPSEKSYIHECLEHTKRYRGSKSSRPHIKGRYIWYQIICNDPKCSAKIRVPESWLLEQIENFLQEK